jgi:hypothetical protein
MSMDQIEYPNGATWEFRRAWFDAEFDIERRGGAYAIGEHATALLVDLQSVFCAGAFISAVILARTIVDAHLGEAELGQDFDGGMQAAFANSGFACDLEWLRRERNALVHFKPARGPKITVDAHYISRTEHEANAKRAISLVASVVFENPWV